MSVVCRNHQHIHIKDTVPYIIRNEMQYYSPYGDFQPILLKCGNGEQQMAAGYDEKFKNFFAIVCNNFGQNDLEFFWVRKGESDVKIDGDKTPMQLNMKRFDAAEVHVRVMKRPNFLAKYGFEDEEPQQKKLKKGPKKPVMSEKPAIVEYSTAEYNNDYRMRSGLGYWMPFAIWEWLQEKYTPGELDLDPDEVY
jgi:hypothetical protein